MGRPEVHYFPNACIYLATFAENPDQVALLILSHPRLQDYIASFQQVTWSHSNFEITT